MFSDPGRTPGEGLDGRTDGPLGRPFVPVPRRLGVPTGRGVWIHEEGPVGEGRPTDDKEAVAGVLRSPGRRRGSVVGNVSDTGGLQTETSRPTMTHNERPSVPDTGDAPVVFG